MLKYKRIIKIFTEEKKQIPCRTPKPIQPDQLEMFYGAIWR